MREYNEMIVGVFMTVMSAGMLLALIVGIKETVKSWRE
jgi:hypothetical protein